MNVLAILGLGIKISIFVSVLSLGMRASFSDIALLFRQPGRLIRALLAIFVVMPIFAILLVKIFTVNPLIAVVLVALSVSPIPPLFPNKAFKSGGETSFTFGLLAAVTLLSIVMIPLAFAVFDAIFVRETQFSETFLIRTLMVAVIIPIAIGMALRYLAPGFCERFAEPLARIGGIVLILSVLPILIAILPTIWSIISLTTVLVLVLFAVLGVAVGYFLGGPDVKERTVLALATASRHPGIAIALASANAGETPKKLLAAAVIIYVIICMIVVAPFLKWLIGEKSSLKTTEGKVA